MKIEDKQKICDYLCKAVQLTRHCEDVMDMRYYPDSEDVIAFRESGRKTIINVFGDSGIAMISDIMRALVL